MAFGFLHFYILIFLFSIYYIFPKMKWQIEDLYKKSFSNNIFLLNQG